MITYDNINIIKFSFFKFNLIFFKFLIDLTKLIKKSIKKIKKLDFYKKCKDLNTWQISRVQKRHI